MLSLDLQERPAIIWHPIYKIGLFLALAWLVCSPAAEDPVPESAAYLLVIDHSGSMNEKAGAKTRWEDMQDRASAFLQLLPLGSRLWIAVFEGDPEAAKRRVFTLDMKTEAERKALMERLRKGYGPPDGGTALYDSIGMALEEAERLSKQSPGRYIAVLVYTDGKDEGSLRWTPDSLQKRFAGVRFVNKNLMLAFTPIGSDLPPPFTGDGVVVGEPKIPIAIQVPPGPYTLENPRLKPSQKVPLDFRISPEAQRLLAGQAASIEFVSDGGKALAVRLPGSPYKLEAGRVEVQLDVADAENVKADQEYSGILKLKYPVLKEHIVIGNDRVALRFQKEEPPKIYDLRPKDGETFAARKEIFFYADTLQNAKVLWDFGDGDSAQGHTGKHAYNMAGERTVQVKVVSDPRVPPTVKTLKLNIIDVATALDPMTGPVFAGAAYTFYLHRPRRHPAL